jgi:tetratricopeptide (TPR) repeat protein
LAAGRVAEAVKLHEENLKRTTAKLGPLDRHTLYSRNALAASYQAAGRMNEAIALHEGTLKLRIQTLSADHPDTLISRNNLAEAYYGAGRLDEAIAEHEETLRLRKAQFGLNHADTFVSMGNLAKSYRAAGRLEEAIPLFAQALQGFRSKLGDEHPYTLATMNYFAEAYLDAGRWAEAEPILRQSLAIRERIQPGRWSTYVTRSQLGGGLLGQKQFAAAEPLILQGYEGLRAREAQIPGPSNNVLTKAADRVVKLYEAWGKPEQASMWKAKLGMADLPVNVFTRP